MSIAFMRGSTVRECSDLASIARQADRPLSAKSCRPLRAQIRRESLHVPYMPLTISPPPLASPISASGSLPEYLDRGPARHEEGSVMTEVPCRCQRLRREKSVIVSNAGNLGREGAGLDVRASG